MHEEKTSKNLLEEKLAEVDDKYDKRQGSVIYTALAPNSMEQAQQYAHIDWLWSQMFGDTADRETLIKIAQDTRGMEPDKATYAERKCEADAPLPIGLGLSLDLLDFTVKEVIEDTAGTGKYLYKVVCNTPGEIGNKYSGAAIPNEFVDALTFVNITDVLIPGEEEEETEVFRKRWRGAFNSMSFGGNKADYKEKINKIEGVGGCKIARATNKEGEIQGGHVMVVIIASDFTVPSDVLVQKVQSMIDPEENAGEGDGLAPIDHTVHIVPVTGVEISVDTNLTLDTGYVFEDIKGYAEQAVEKYFLSLNKGWEEKENEPIAIRIAQIESAILAIEGVIDISGTQLNGLEENIILKKYEIAVRGEVSG